MRHQGKRQEQPGDRPQRTIVLLVCLSCQAAVFCLLGLCVLWCVWCLWFVCVCFGCWLLAFGACCLASCVRLLSSVLRLVSFALGFVSRAFGFRVSGLVVVVRFCLLCLLALVGCHQPSALTCVQWAGSKSPKANEELPAEPRAPANSSKQEDKSITKCDGCRRLCVTKL